MRTAIVLGATGLTGGILLRRLLEDGRYALIKSFSRRPVGISHPKLEEHILDFREFYKCENIFKADHIFCCVGSTKAKTPDLEVYRKIDHGIPVSAARLAKSNSIDTLLIVSALGADPESRFFYNKVKGEMERDVLKAGIPNTYFFQPSLISGDRKEKRIFEYLWKQVMKLGNYLLFGPLEKYRSIHPEEIARAMISVANKGYTRVRIESDEIKVIARKGETKNNDT